MVELLVLLVTRLECQFQCIPHLSWRLARILEETLYPAIKAHLLTILPLCFLLLITIIDLLLFQEEE